MILGFRVCLMQDKDVAENAVAPAANLASLMRNCRRCILKVFRKVGGSIYMIEKERKAHEF